VQQQQQPDYSKSFAGGSRGPAFGRQELEGSSHGNKSVPVEESSKLNLLIEEYRRENDRCSKRINELQRKLNATANRR
jgi:hypothetical protein